MAVSVIKVDNTFAKDITSQFTLSDFVSNFHAYKMGELIIVYGILNQREYSNANLIFTGRITKKMSYQPLLLFDLSTNKPVTKGVIYFQSTGEHRYFGDTITGNYYFNGVIL